MHHLIHVGYAKAGSTILQRWFAAHPQIAFARTGIAGFETVFDIAGVAVARQGDRRLRVTSEESLVTPDRRASDAGVTLAEQARSMPHSGIGSVCDELADMFPDASVLIVTRGFREVMRSGYSQYLRDGGRDRFFALDPAFGSDDHRSRHTWHYGRAIELYRNAFSGRVIVLPFEMLRDDPDGFLRVLEERFGLSHQPLPKLIDNPSLSGVELLWYPRFARLLNHLPVPPRVGRSIRRTYRKLLARGMLKPLARLAQVIRPGDPIQGMMISDAVLDRFRHKADVLREEPAYRPYAREYLFDPAPGGAPVA